MRNITSLIAVLCVTLFASAQQNPLIKWSFETNGKILSHPIIDKNCIYFGSNDSVFYAVDIYTGGQCWNFKTNSNIQSKAVINNDIIYFKSGNDVFALNKDTGQEIWVLICKDKKGATQIDLWDYHSGAPAIFNSIIYFGFGNGTLKGFDLKTGETRNEILRTDSSAIKSGLVIEKSILYFGDWDGRIHAYNLNTSIQLWSHNTYEKKLYDTFGQSNTQLSIHNNLLYFGGRNPELQVLDKNTGEKKWSYIEEEGGWISGDPMVLNDTLFIGGSDNHKMIAFNANSGEKYWSFLFLNNNFSKPLVYKKYLLFTTGDAYSVFGKSPGRGYIYAINRSNGRIKNFTQIGGNIYSNLVIMNDILYMGTTDNNLYALNLNTFLNEKSNLRIKGHNSVDILGVYPSPFIDTAKITYDISYNTKVNIKIKDINENEVIELYTGEINQGEHFIVWDGKDKSGNAVKAGNYICEISSGEYYKKVFIQKQIPDKKDN